MSKKHQGDLTTYPENFLDCRPGMSGHEWRWDTDFRILRNTKGEITEFSRRMKCSRCTSKRRKVYDGRTGKLLRSGYDYVDGYTIDSTVFEVEPGMAALECLRRAMAAQKVIEEVFDGAA